MQQINRDVISQPFSSFVVVAGVAPTPLVPNPNKTDLVDSLIISVDAAAANNVFMGDANVTIATGIEIVAGGGPVNFKIQNQVQQYDLQLPLLDAVRTLQCQDDAPFGIPFVVWDCSQLFLIAIANTNVRVMLFRSQFI